MKLSTLQLIPLHRIGSGSDGWSRTERWTFDFVVDGESLADLLGATGRDLVGRLDRDDREQNAQSIRVLTGAATPDIEGQVMLFVCPECGGLGCGAITAALVVDADTVTWSDFKHENSYDESMTTRFPGVGPLVFSRHAYEEVLSQACAR